MKHTTDRSFIIQTATTIIDKIDSNYQILKNEKSHNEKRINLEGRRNREEIDGKWKMKKLLEP